MSNKSETKLLFSFVSDTTFNASIETSSLFIPGPRSKFTGNLKLTAPSYITGFSVAE